MLSLLKCEYSPATDIDVLNGMIHSFYPGPIYLGLVGLFAIGELIDQFILRDTNDDDFAIVPFSKIDHIVQLQTVESYHILPSGRTITKR